MFKFFGKDSSSSKDIAKERLKLVLIHDRANVSPRFLEMLKADIIRVISDYMEIEEKEMEIELSKIKSSDGAGMVPALIANIPIKKLKPGINI
jgi:cell division topological specificity factor